MPLFCGVEGGATNTTLLILNERAEILGRAAGGCSNHYLTSLPAVAELLAGLARSALAAAGLPPPSEGASAPPVFHSFGACMSGFLAAGPQRDLEALLRSAHPWLSASYYIDNDSPGSIFTAAKGAGGCVIIAGTGSMGQLMLPSGEVVNCGGHGHAYGDGALLLSSRPLRPSPSPKAARCRSPPPPSPKPRTHRGLRVLYRRHRDPPHFCRRGRL